MSELNTGELTPKSNSKVDAMRFSGALGQPDGFGSVLDVTINVAGDATLTLQWKQGLGDKQGAINMWSVTLNERQRDALGQMLCKYQTRHYERY